MAKRKRSAIGRKPKITKKPSLKHYDTLDNETNCKSDSTNLCKISEASLMHHETFTNESESNSDPKKTCNKRKRKKLGIGRKLKKTSQIHDLQNKTDEAQISSTLSESISNSQNNQQSKYKRYNQSEKGRNRTKKFFATDHSKITKK